MLNCRAGPIVDFGAISRVCAAGRDCLKMRTADEHLPVRSRALVHGYCAVPDRRLHPLLVS
jgi:hypothetical protein